MARLPWGLTVQGGAEHGRKLADGCAARAKLPELGTGPTGASEQFRYRERSGDNTAGFPLRDEPLLPLRRTLQDRLPWARHIYDSASGRPGGSDVDERAWGVLEANFVADNAWIAAGPQPLPAGLSPAPPLREPDPAVPMFADDANNMSFRVAKIFRYGGDADPGWVDLYNLMNVDVVTTTTRRSCRRPVA